MKPGRPRQFVPIAGQESELAQLAELHARATDLIEDIPDEQRRTELFGHTLDGLYGHLIWAEDRLFGSIAGDVAGDGSLTMAELEERTQERLAGRSLADPFHGSRFTTIGEAVRHVQWHWAYHGGQMGLIRKQLGYRYQWR